LISAESILRVAAARAVAAAIWFATISRSRCTSRVHTATNAGFNSSLQCGPLPRKLAIEFG
jgi:hypothetical protein